MQFLGWQAEEELNAEYQRADIVIMPSRWPEPFGMVGVEAMSFAKPVVAFDTGGGIRDWLRDQETGILVPPNDVKKMAAAINGLSSDSVLRLRMGQRGRERVSRIFCKDRYQKQVLEIYENLKRQSPQKV